ncbi:MAG: heme-binding protein [Pseudomonadales bacterium]|uniref:Heme-binding protein n=1 Tax=Delftia tsuruhatensis TaxID=180282 RepID=A0AAX3SVR2_9BURK|nr:MULTISPECIES: heme-binding protein [Delftia]WFF84108.1 heme-binding protein [Delftia tsuruhatensis]
MCSCPQGLHLRRDADAVGRPGKTDAAVPTAVWINTADPRVVLFAGGYPLFVNGKFVGAFGVGGGSWDQDEKIGQTVLKPSRRRPSKAAWSSENTYAEVERSAALPHWRDKG